MKIIDNPLIESVISQAVEPGTRVPVHHHVTKDGILTVSGNE